MESKKQKNKQAKSRKRPIKTENKLMAARGVESGEMGKGEQEIQASSYGTHKSQG